MKNRVWEAVIIVFVIFVSSFIGNSVITYITGYNGVVTVNELIEIGQGKYQVSINISNFSNNNLENIRINLPTDIDTDKIKSNQPLSIVKITSNLGKDNGSIFEINRIFEKQKADILFLLDKPIDTNKIVIAKNDNNIEVEYLNNIKSPFQKEVKNNIILALIYAIVVSIMFYIIGTRQDKANVIFKTERDEVVQKIKDNQEIIKQDTIKMQDELKEGYIKVDKQNKDNYIIMEESLARIDKEMEDVKQKHNNEVVNHKKQIILLLSRLRDYSKELDFWRDTIRKVTYKSINEYCL